MLPERVLVGKLIGKVEKMVKYFPLGRIIGASVSEPHTVVKTASTRSMIYLLYVIP